GRWRGCRASWRPRGRCGSSGRRSRCRSRARSPRPASTSSSSARAWPTCSSAPAASAPGRRARWCRWQRPSPTARWWWCRAPWPSPASHASRSARRPSRRCRPCPAWGPRSRRASWRTGRSRASTTCCGCPASARAPSSGCGRWWRCEARGMTGAPGRHVPWPQPLALGMVAGVAAAGGLAPRVMAAAGMAALLAGALLLARRRWRWPSTLTGGWAAWAAFLAPVLLAAGVGALRLAAFEARPDPLVGRYGTQATWRGYSDGDTLHARAPVRARLALVAPSGGWPGGRAPIGELEVTGVVEAAPGKRNPGGFDLAAHLRRRGVAGQLFVREHALGAAAFPLKQRLQRGVQAGMAPDTAALTAAMTLGLRDDLGELRGSFAASGLAHLLALSGLHVGVLLLAAERLMRPLGRWRTPALLLATAGFVALVGPSPSIVRAATMAAAALASRTFGAGRVQPWTALALACLIGLLSAPQML